MKTDLFQSCGHCWVFHICWHIEHSTLVALSFRIWNSSAEIPSPQLALFIVMLPKAHLTSHSTISGCGWVITPSWLSGSIRCSFYSSLCIPATSSLYLLLLLSPYYFSTLFCLPFMKLQIIVSFMEFLHFIISKTDSQNPVITKSQDLVSWVFNILEYTHYFPESYFDKFFPILK